MDVRLGYTACGLGFWSFDFDLNWHMEVATAGHRKKHALLTKPSYKFSLIEPLQRSNNRALHCPKS